MKGADSVDTVSRAEMVESDLDRLITKRDTQRRETEGHRPSEEMYEEGCRRLAEQRQQELAQLWLEHHQRQLRSHQLTSALLVRHHQEEIQRYERMLGLDGPSEATNGHKESA